jgi:hypothetical protein
VKDQYFADKRDFFKWDFLEDLLDGCAELKSFTNITMLTPPDDSSQGNLRVYEVGLRREPLCRFLQGCLTDGKQKVSEMRRYFQGKRFSYYPHRDSAASPYSYESRQEYFDSIPQAKLQQALVFFDPDIGLQTGSMGYMQRSGISKYLFDESLTEVARRISDDSVIVVYQHLQRDRNRFWDDVEVRCGRFRNRVGAKGAGFLTDREIVFLATSRNPTLRLKMSNIVVAHAHKYNLDSGELAA